MTKTSQTYLNSFFYSLVIVLFLLCCYFYPTTRDEFYYLDGMINVFTEYYSSYMQVNARIGQFFSNLAGRSKFFEQLTGAFIFIGFFYTFYLNVFQKKPKFSFADSQKLIVIIGLFIFLINYFGEMFFYVPFSTNYTLTNIFYLLYIFLLTQVFIFKRDVLEEKRIPFVFVFLFGFFVGMGNEHAPPVLLAVTAIHFLIQMINKKQFYFSSKKLVVTFFGILSGYIVLFLAPANKVRFAREGKKEFGFNLLDYLENLKSIGKIYYYYNSELLITAFIALLLGLALLFSKRLKKRTVFELSSYLMMVFLAVLVVAYSPIVGTRLLFFSNVLIIISILIIFLRTYDVFTSHKLFRNTLTVICSGYILFYFSASLYICYNSKQNYDEVISEIENKSVNTKDVVISKSFHYGSKYFGTFNRKVLLDFGDSYIDNDSVNNSSVEKNLLNFYKINSLKTQNGEK